MQPSEETCPFASVGLSEVCAPPQIRAVPWWAIPKTLIGLMRKPLETFAALNQDYGDMVQIAVPGKISYVLYNPALVQRMLIQDASLFQKSVNYNEFAPLLGKGLVTSDGALWRKQREVIAGSFSLAQVKSFSSIIETHASAWVQDLLKPLPPAGGQVDIHKPMMSLTYLIIGEALFGSDLADSIRIVGKTLPICTDYLMQRIFLRIPAFIPLPGHALFTSALAELNQVVYELIRHERARGSAQQNKTHLLAKLIHATDATHRMSDELLRDEVMTLLLAGHETTANALSWAAYALAHAPDQADRMRKEVRDVSEQEGGIHFAAYKKLVFTKAVVQEAMRLYPPAYLLSRSPLSTGVWQGISLHPSQVFYLPIWQLHRLKNLWPDPETFQADRFTGPLTSQQKMAFLPFGAGERRCIGSELAMVEAVLILAHLIAACDISPPDGPCKPDPSLTLRATHVRVHVRKRC